MHFPIVAIALSAVALAAKLTEHDKLAAQGLDNIAADVSKHGYPAPRSCTLETAAVRKEWYTPPSHSILVSFPNSNQRDNLPGPFSPPSKS